MKPNQINFFFMPEDILEIDNYLNLNKILIVSQPMPSEQLRIVDSITLFETPLDKKWNKKYLIHEMDKSQIVVKQIKEQNYNLSSKFKEEVEIKETLKIKLENKKWTSHKELKKLLKL